MFYVVAVFALEVASFCKAVSLTQHFQAKPGTVWKVFAVYITIEGYLVSIVLISVISVTNAIYFVSEKSLDLE